MPAALKAVAALVALAVVFVVAAIVGGGSGGGGPASSAPAPLSGGSHTPAGAQAGTPAELGYPAFATDNTTRVGGPDPISNAAGVALATYPSVEASQRPAAVTLVDAADWQTAIAASVLMAAPLGPPSGVPAGAVKGAPTGAPLLISAAGGVPKPTSEALGALDPRGNGMTGGAQVFAMGRAAVPGGLRTRRIAAADPAAGAAAIAALRDRLFGSPPKHLLIASSEEPGFAMPAAAWAARSGDPILFSNRDRLPPATAAVLRRRPGTPVFVLGPSSAISASVVRQIAAIDPRVRRVAGADPVSSAIALARYAGGGFGWNVNDPGHGFVVARSDSPLDAAAAAPLSASGSWGPLLLTDSAATLPAALRGYLLDVKPGYTTDPTRAFYNHVWVIGNEEAIDLRQQAEIDALAGLVKIGRAP
ncbi:MAG TPA: cell wall-binding repeat-containing protein [Solirubrobacterales bacterium]|nr:cell wall-binding repeat-containing protein [Solirubrobacterales bacterium]